MVIRVLSSVALICGALLFSVQSSGFETQWYRIENPDENWMPQIGFPGSDVIYVGIKSEKKMNPVLLWHTQPSPQFEKSWSKVQKKQIEHDAKSKGYLKSLRTLSSEEWKLGRLRGFAKVYIYYEDGVMMKEASLLVPNGPVAHMALFTAPENLFDKLYAPNVKPILKSFHLRK